MIAALIEETESRPAALDLGSYGFLRVLGKRDGAVGSLDGLKLQAYVHALYAGQLAKVAGRELVEVVLRTEDRLTDQVAVTYGGGEVAHLLKRGEGLGGLFQSRKIRPDPAETLHVVAEKIRLDERCELQVTLPPQRLQASPSLRFAQPGDRREFPEG